MASFSSSTATAHDKLPPRILEHLDDGTIREILLLFKRAEHEGRWPEQWRVATLVMIPKAEAYKWRLIAMLVTPYRVWARMEGEKVFVWMSSLKRTWIANGPKQSAEDAVYEIALQTEADLGEYGKTNVIVLDDLEKGFEKVTHSNLCDKAKVYDFPP